MQMGSWKTAKCPSRNVGAAFVVSSLPNISVVLEIEINGSIRFTPLKFLF